MGIRRGLTDLSYVSARVVRVAARARPKDVEDKKLKSRLGKVNRAREAAAARAARNELLLAEDAGFIETEGIERSYHVKQADIVKAVPVSSANKVWAGVGQGTRERVGGRARERVGGRARERAGIDRGRAQSGKGKVEGEGEGPLCLLPRLAPWEDLLERFLAHCQRPQSPARWPVRSTCPSARLTRPLRSPYPPSPLAVPVLSAWPRARVALVAPVRSPCPPR